MNRILIRNGKVLTGGGNLGGNLSNDLGGEKLDILIEGEHIIGIEKDITKNIAKNSSSKLIEIDASECLVAPGLVDIHTHLRQPGTEEAETIESGSLAAALGGFTAVLAMPNTEPAIDSVSVVREIKELSKRAFCDIHIAGAITKNRQGETLAPMAEMAELGVKMFTDDGRGVQDAGLMRRALEYSSNLSVRLAQHCEVESLAAGGQMNEGEWSSKLGLKGIPAAAEELMVARDIALSELTGASVHFQHLSTAGSVELVSQARAKGLNITAEAAPHHFSLTEECLSDFDPIYKVNPPLRSKNDVAAIAGALKGGAIDVIATDHAPHCADLKEQPFEDAPCGMLGLETALSLSLMNLDMSPEDVIRVLSINPATIAKMEDQGGQNNGAKNNSWLAEGNVANLFVFDPTEKWIVDKTKSPSRSRNNPYDKMEMTGKVMHTIYRGRQVVADFKLVEAELEKVLA